MNLPSRTLGVYLALVALFGLLVAYGLTRPSAHLSHRISRPDARHEATAARAGSHPASTTTTSLSSSTPSWVSDTARAALPGGSEILGCSPDDHPVVMPAPDATDTYQCYAFSSNQSVLVVVGHSNSGDVGQVVGQSAPSLPAGATIEGGGS